MLVEALLFAALLFLLWQSFRKPEGLPPGRWGLPLVGCFPFSTRIEEQVMDLHRRHGDIFVWRMGTQVMVFLNDYKLVKEVLTRPEFTDRPDWELLKFFEDPPVGISPCNGAIWHNNRRFALRQLRDLGMGKSKLVEAIQHQAMQLTESFAKQSGRVAPLPHDLHVAVVNVIWQMVASKQFTSTDPLLKEFVELMTSIVIASNRLAIKDFMPWLQNVMPTFLFRYLINYHSIMEMKDKFFRFFYEEIQHHRATLDPEHPRDVMDGYLLEMEEKKDDPDSTYSERDLAFIVFDLFFAGSETTTTTFTWYCGYLAAYLDVQKKLQAEIDAVLPKGVQATLEDKSRMPYTEATINEVLRHSSLVNFSLPRMASTDTNLGGYIIPKGAILNTSSSAIHYDGRYWDRPREFLPERWLDEAGKFTTKKEGFLPFGVGKRVCIGEGLARMELFILISTVFQSFSVAPPLGKTLDLTPDMESPFFHKPNFGDLLFTARE